MFDLFKKTEVGVKRSREAWFGKIASVFNRDTLGTEVWDELEELLVSADVGVETTSKLLDNVKRRVKADKLTEVSRAKDILKDEMVSLLGVRQSAAPCDNSLFPQSRCVRPRCAVE